MDTTEVGEKERVGELRVMRRLVWQNGDRNDASETHKIQRREKHDMDWCVDIVVNNKLENVFGRAGEVSVASTRASFEDEIGTKKNGLAWPLS